ncbi:MAG TPA: hypothetical protein PLU23_03355, partial [Anaerolineaceae bacterium]|nr:hypothetical protein [Anaerolineaceae bacterium]
RTREGTRPRTTALELDISLISIMNNAHDIRGRCFFGRSLFDNKVLMFVIVLMSLKCSKLQYNETTVHHVSG